jgi:chorismate lyase/3-hydroxybenzoate synthase
MSLATSKCYPLRIALGGSEPGSWDTGVPVLAGEPIDDFFGQVRPVGQAGALQLFQAGDWLLGAATVPLGPGLEEATHRLYDDIITASRGSHLARIWNYVPAINEPGPGGLENYQLFCRGRSLAFEQHYGSGFKAMLPSASAVGCKAGELTVTFAANPALPRHVENPRQVPAYDYPGAYGPRAPSFARATVVPGTKDASVFISGTAAILGHATVAPHNLRQQLECTLENLGDISQACGLGSRLNEGGPSTRRFKVYVRHAADQPLVAAILEERLLSGTDRVSYLHADICRAPLLVEVEVSLFGVKIRF